MLLKYRIICLYYSVVNNNFFYLGTNMKNKFILLATLVVFLFSFSSCYMRGEYGTPYHVWHPAGRAWHRHWGVSYRSSAHHRFWGRHRYGPRPHSYRGHYHY